MKAPSAPGLDAATDDRIRPGFLRRVPLKNGHVATLRWVEPADLPVIEQALSELSLRSRFFRFHSLFARPSEATLRTLVEIDPDDHVALVATELSLDLKTERGIGIARLVRDPKNASRAEVAITVLDAYQGLGVGTLLGTLLRSAAKERGIHTLYAEVLSENDVARAALETAGARKVEGGKKATPGVTTYEIAVLVADDAKVREWLGAFRVFTRMFHDEVEKWKGGSAVGPEDSDWSMDDLP